MRALVQGASAGEAARLLHDPGGQVVELKRQTLDGCLDALRVQKPVTK